jgi:phage gpG-like protein
MKVTGITEVRKALAALEKEILQRQKTAVKLAANEYKNDVQQDAPYKTGTYRRSIHVEMQGNDAALVGTNLPYARRLEFGFAGADNLGRVYNYSGKPHFRPNLDKNWQKYVKTYEEELYG